MPQALDGRVAVIADVHANAPALDAVLRELRALDVELVVELGDLLSGPLPVETLALVLGFGGGMVHVRGNADRELVAALDDPGWAPPEGQEAMGAATRFAARALRGSRARLPGRARSLTLDVAGLGAVRCCHGTPRSDTEVVTTATPDALVAAFLAGVEEDVVVGGHTHTQFDRRVGRHRVLNAGSVGMPYEERPGAYWALVDAGSVELRRTEYDLEAAAADIRASGYPDAEDFAAENVLAPPPPSVAVPILEAAGRRADSIG